MITGKSHERVAETLQKAAASYQEAHVIPHCVQCSNPCCKLQALVLELNWKQVKVLWHRDESRAAFDKLLASGQGPEEIRKGDDGLYYAHRKPCPAYDQTRGSCSVYNQPVKPVGCTDFPVYEDGDQLVADLRCEAVDLETLTAWIADALGPGFRIARSADRDFPFLVSLTVKKAGTGPKPGRRPGR